MKKALKIIAITFGIIIVLVLVCATIAVNYVFSPDNTTKIVKQQAEQYLNCKFELGEVELTLFSTFPNFGLEINQLTLINPSTGVPSDTLIHVDKAQAILNIKALLNKEVILEKLSVNNLFANVFMDSTGKTNFDVFTVDESKEDSTAFQNPFRTIQLKNISFNNLNLSLVDEQQGINTKVIGLRSNLVAMLDGNDGQTNFQINIPEFSAQYKEGDIFARINNFESNLSAAFTMKTLDGKFNISTPDASLSYGTEQYLQNAAIKLNLPINIQLIKQSLTLNDASFALNNNEITLEGDIGTNSLNGDIVTDLAFNISRWNIKETLSLIPASLLTAMKGVEADGTVTLAGTVTGIYNKVEMPKVSANLKLEGGTVKYTGFPLALHAVEGDINFSSDMKTDSISFIQINSFTARTPKSKVTLNGRADNLLSDAKCNLNFGFDLFLSEFKPMIPKDIHANVSGNTDGNINARFSLSQIEKQQLDCIRANGKANLHNIDAVYDTVKVSINEASLQFNLAENLKSILNSDQINLSQGNNTTANIKGTYLDVDMPNILSTSPMDFINSEFSFSDITASMGNMSLSINAPQGKANIKMPEGSFDNTNIVLEYQNKSLEANMGEQKVLTHDFSINTNITRNPVETNSFLQWIPNGSVALKNATISTPEVKEDIKIPTVQFDFTPEKYTINDSRFVLGRSDFQLYGYLDNVSSYLRHDSLLMGDFKFVSNNTDINSIMELTSGIGYEEEQEKTAESKDTASTSSGPFMVPKGMFINLETNIKNAYFGNDTARNIIGNVTVNDGVLALQDVKFNTSAADMYLTALYKTPRKNHLFVGLDYHMMNIEIEELLRMIPDIDSIMPMLRSFGGKGEFHMAVETYTDSLYNLKKSTLRGSASITGQDLVLMDGETFSEIAKTLRFNKKTQNKVDSLAAEFTIFKNEIDVYPFLIVMDKYKAIIGGRHNLDMSFNYHISVIDCPLPIRLGLNISGNLDKMKFGIGKCKYSNLYRPTSRKVVQSSQLELKKMIRQELEARIKEKKSE